LRQAKLSFRGSCQANWNPRDTSNERDNMTEITRRLRLPLPPRC
jgi:hypothetical protein